MATEFLNMKAILEFIVLSKKDPLCRPWLNSKSSGVCSDTRIYMLYPRENMVELIILWFKPRGFKEDDVVAFSWLLHLLYR